MAEHRLNTGQQMRKVKVNKQELLVKLYQNKALHVKEYNEAVKEFQTLALKEIELKIDAVTKELRVLAGKVKDKPIPLIVEESLFFDVTPPESHEEDFAEIIALFEAEVDTTVELEQTEFNRYYLNKWIFANKLKETREFYASKSIGMVRIPNS